MKKGDMKMEKREVKYQNVYVRRYTVYYGGNWKHNFSRWEVG
jgi:hypothetical protein